ncbi:serine hydrolase domain-containing protein [Haliangium sp.]|uniref:serine hydrolase domain-containing protein n=1 Tax=Haliangium sp. TaxID=2663208 RepID=UPI003D0CE043
MRSRYWLGLGGVLIVCACGGAEAPITPPPPPPPPPVSSGDPVQDALDARVPALLGSQPGAGLVVGAVSGSRARVYGYGRVRPDRAGSPDGDTVYELGSLTQVFTAVLLAEATIQGEVALTDPVAAHLPAEARYADADADAEPVRLVHLATHTAGWPRWPSNLGRHARRGGYERRHLLRWLRAASPATTPGQEVHESHAGTAVLGLALAQRAGKDYEDLLLERVVLPLGMARTRVVPSADMRSRLAQGHDRDGAPTSPPRPSPALAPCCGLHSTAGDVLRLVAAYLRTDSRLAATLDLTLDAPAAAELAAADRDRVGLGWRATPAPITYSYSGESRSSRGYIGFRRDLGVGVVVLASSAAWDVDALGQAALEALAEDAREPATALSRARARPADRDP